MIYSLFFFYLRLLWDFTDFMFCLSCIYAYKRVLYFYLFWHFCDEYSPSWQWMMGIYY